MSGYDTLAHGIGGRQDLPIPLSYAVIGAVWALIISFLVLGVFWTASRFRGDAAGRALPRAVQTVVDSPRFRWAVRLIGLAVTAFVVYAAVFGPDLANNPTGFVFVMFWVGLVPLSLLFGPVWRLLNPLRTVHALLARAMGLRPEEGLLELPISLGYWPAAVSLFSFVWLELAAPDRATTEVLRAYFAGYAGAHLLAAAAYGSTWFARGDGFEVYSALIGRLAPIGRRADGRLVLRNPLEGLDGLRAGAGPRRDGVRPARLDGVRRVLRLAVVDPVDPGLRALADGHRDTRPTRHDRRGRRCVRRGGVALRRTRHDPAACAA